MGFSHSLACWWCPLTVERLGGSTIGVMMSPASTGTDPWEIVEYEARMLFDLCRLLSSEGFKPDNDIVNNAVVESACLHTRILVDILLSKDSGKGDDILLSQLLP